MKLCVNPTFYLFKIDTVMGWETSVWEASYFTTLLVTQTT